jgi:arsenate reductase
VAPNVVRYLDTPLDAAALTALLAKLGLGARQAMRKNETIYKELGLGDPNMSEAELIAAIAAHPILLERAIVVSGDKAVIARPPEKLLEIL